MKKATLTSALRLPTLVCAWCKDVIRTGSPKISHGICRPCVVQQFGKLPSSMRGLPRPHAM